jgi:pimeloyl-ACP methyl ester carboxylesterase
MRHSALHLISLLLAALFCQTPAVAQRIDAAAYHYPYQDPYLATMTSALLQGNETLANGEIKDLRIKMLSDRDDLYLLEGMGAIRYRFYQQNKLAPLIFIIPGLGGSAYSGAAAFLAEWYANHGYHVLILPSPFSWNFTLGANTSGFPGYTQEDAEDLYALMRLVLNDAKTRGSAQIGKIGLLGFSDGALYAGYVSKIDTEKKLIGIDTTLLVNPPVDLFAAARKIDQMVDAGKVYGTDQKAHLEAYAFGKVVEAMSGKIDDPHYFADWDKRIKLNDRQIEYLIGKNFQDSVGDAIYAIDLANDLTFLKTPVNWSHRDARLAEARAYGLMHYVETQVVPRLRRLSNKSMSLKALDKQNSMRTLKTELENNQAIFLMHNLDDILVSADGMAYLEKVFGKRAAIYPRGGHLGNLWYPDNKDHLLEVFKPLL